MKIPFKIAVSAFFILYLIPVIGMWFLVQNRIQERQSALQRFLQNQVDIDRQIISERARLRTVNFSIRTHLLSAKNSPSPFSTVKDEMEKFQRFWKRYASAYSSQNRIFLQSILEENQETNLVSEEAEIIQQIFKKSDIYFVYVSSYPPLQATAAAADNITFLANLDERRNDLYGSLDQLADIRYIFGQRVVFSVSGENDRQGGFFTAIFVALAAFIFVISTMEYFYIHKPFKDIILFLKDISQGKKGQRLYFSSPIKEIKESEEIINQFVNKAEEHEKEK